ncbi:hypothetical protein C9374_013115 [Naegleria lovaniensis]|uniref:Protein phosphatase methylesterase 1 n=1 Tax=Naegleria lovaniensis TaxID=51637 RepID=A0AA88GC75_NAELO|nr:uncharacterized protein C9374_013115 [Naegleria lovaniensis]KAG2372835.1 hypothetical protein C9374_013115 [Naegleria lovaniensis]
MQRDLFTKKLSSSSSGVNHQENSTMGPPSSMSMPSTCHPTSRSPQKSPNSNSPSSSEQDLQAFKPVLDYSAYFEPHDVHLEERGTFRVYTINHSSTMKNQPVPTTTTSEPSTISSASIKSININNSILGKKSKSDTVLVFIHGAGFTSLSWALCIKHLQQFVIKSGGNMQNINFLRSPPTPMEMGNNNILTNAFDDYEYCAIDLRAHGASHTSTNDLDLSIETLVDDVTSVLQKVYQGKKRDFVLIGHSLGGAIAVRVAAKMDKIEDEQKKAGLQVNSIMTVRGVIVIDMVEGSALSSLPNTKRFLESRPKKFKTMEAAIKWSVQNGVVNNIQSACISIPSQLQAISDEDHSEIMYYKWRTALEHSEQYWTDWFTNMSKLFLSVRGVKLLMITSTDILDKELTIAQMQGKFQMKVLNRTGHCIQEDDPSHTAEVLFSFLSRFRL